MARTIVYEVPTAQRGADGFASKLAKYVPVEMITLSTTFFGVFDVKGYWVWVAVAVAGLLNSLYLWTVNRSSDTPAPRAYFYLLSLVSYVLWALATVDAVATAAGLSGTMETGQRAFMLTVAALFVPALDSALSVQSLQPRLQRVRLA